MNTPFLTVTVCTPRDVVRVRQLARQAAALLSFEALDQVCLAAAAFDLAWQAWQPDGQATVSFTLYQDIFRISCVQERSLGRPPLMLEKPLPASQRGILHTDLAWTLEQVIERSPVHVLKELQTVNRELLRTLLELAAYRQQSSAPAAVPTKETDAA
jgi:hypothetical protein